MDSRRLITPEEKRARERLIERLREEENRRRVIRRRRIEEHQEAIRGR